MVVKIKQRGIDLGAMIERAEKINGRRVIVGPKGERNRRIAKVQEYGATNVPVGGEFGEFWRKRTGRSTINIPERSFIRNGWDSNEGAIMPVVELVAKQYARGAISEDTLFSSVGNTVANAIKDYMRTLNDPPNSPLVVEFKGFNDPLIHTGELLRSVDYDVE